MLLCSGTLDNEHDKLTIASEEDETQAISLAPRHDMMSLASNAAAVERCGWWCMPASEPNLQLVNVFETSPFHAMTFTLPPHVSPLKGFAAVVAFIDSKIAKQ